MKFGDLSGDQLTIFRMLSDIVKDVTTRDEWAKMFQHNDDLGDGVLSLYDLVRSHLQYKLDLKEIVDENVHNR